MYDISENKSYDIAAYGFGKKTEQHGFEILSCVSAREGKKIFGNDPDITEVKPDFDLLADWITKNPSGKVAAAETLLRKYGYDDATVHHRTVLFTSQWRTDALNMPDHSLLYHAGAYSQFKMPGVCRLTSVVKDGSSVCVGPQDARNYQRKVYKYETSGRFKPETEGSIIVPTEDCYIQGFLLKRHMAFKCTVTDWQSFNVTKPTWLIEFTTDEVDPVATGRQWLQQFEDGLIEFVDRVPKEYKYSNDKGLYVE